jgi:hypothetical protein
VVLSHCFGQATAERCQTEVDERRMRKDIVHLSSSHTNVLAAGVLAVAMAMAGWLAATPAFAATTSASASATGQVDTGAAESRMHGFDLSLSISDSTGLNAVGQNYRNELGLSIEPRWSVGKVYLKDKGVLSKLTLTGRFVLNRAFAGTSDEGFGTEVNDGPNGGCSNLVPSENGGVIDPRQVQYCNPKANSRRTDYSDISLGASLPKVATIPRIKVDVSPGLRLGIPISKQSRFSSLRLGTGASVAFGRTFLGDKLRAGYSFGFTKNFHKYSTAGLDADSTGGTAAEAGGNPYSPVSGVGTSNLYATPDRVGMTGFNTSFSFSNSISASYKINDSWSVDGLYMWTDGFSYGHTCEITVEGVTQNTCDRGMDVAAASGSDTTSRGHRKGQVLWLTASYDWRPWLGFSLAWATWAPRLKPDSSFRQGLISTDYNSFTSVILSASTSLDEVLKAVGHDPKRTQP